MSKRYFLLIVGAFALCMFAMVGSGGWRHLRLVVNIPSLIMIIFLPLLLSLSNYSWKEGVRAFRVSFAHVQAERQELESALVFFGSLGRYFILAGFFGFMSGVIAMLANLGDPSAIGSGFALALLVVYYALMLELLVIVPFGTALKKRLAGV